MALVKRIETEVKNMPRAEREKSRRKQTKSGIEGDK